LEQKYFYFNGRAAEGIIKITLLTWVDRLLGVIFAILKTAFILSLIFYLLNSINGLWDFLPKEKFADSHIYHFVSRIAPAVFPYIRNL
jgi:membrane protein required for colicin V production